MTDVIGLGREMIPSKSSDILDASYSDKGGSSKVHYGTHCLLQSEFNNRSPQSDHNLWKSQTKQER